MRRGNLPLLQRTRRWLLQPLDHLWAICQVLHVSKTFPLSQIVFEVQAKSSNYPSPYFASNPCRSRTFCVVKRASDRQRDSLPCLRVRQGLRCVYVSFLCLKFVLRFCFVLKIAIIQFFIKGKSRALLLLFRAIVHSISRKVNASAVLINNWRETV